MNKNTTALKLLRQQILIGFTEGYKVLEQTNGDVDAAVLIIRKKYLDAILNNTNADSLKAAQLLIRYNYDVDKVLNIIYDEIEEQYFTETEVVIRRHGKYQMEMLERVASLLERDASRELGVERLQPKDLLRINKYYRCVLVLTEWAYDNEESWLYGLLSSWPTAIVDQINLLPDLALVAGAMRTMIQIEASIREELQHENDSYKVYQAVQDDELYREANNYVSSNRTNVILKLHEFVISNVDLFP